MSAENGTMIDRPAEGTDIYRTISILPLEHGEGERTVEVPRGAQFLGVTKHREAPALIVLYNPKAEKETRSLQIVCNGKPLGDRTSRYVGHITFEFEVPIPRGVIIPAGVDPANAKALQVVFIHVFENLAPNQPIQ